MAAAGSPIDETMVHRGVQLANKMESVLKSFLPDTDPQLIGDVVCNLESLWAAGHKLDKTLTLLCELKFPQHREYLRDVLSEIEVNQLYNSRIWIQELRHSVPKLRDALNRPSRRHKSPVFSPKTHRRKSRRA
jgi:hypothetical protein